MALHRAYLSRQIEHGDLESQPGSLRGQRGQGVWHGEPVRVSCGSGLPAMGKTHLVQD